MHHTHTHACTHCLCLHTNRLPALDITSLCPHSRRTSTHTHTLTACLHTNHLPALILWKPQLEDFDDGVVHQLNAKRTEDEAVAAVRNIAHYELGTIQHMAAYLNHVVKNFNAAAAAAAAAAADTTVGLSNALAAAAAAAVAANSAAAAVHGGRMQQLLGAGMLSGNGSLGSTVGAGRGGPAGGGGTAGGLGAYGGQIRLTSVPVSTKAMLQKLPLKVFKQIELLVQNSAYLEWRHFDAGVIKVRGSRQLFLVIGCFSQSQNVSQLMSTNTCPCQKNFPRW